MDLGTGQPILVIDYGSVVTVAVLRWPDGRWQPVLVDGSPMRPSAVAVDDSGRLLTGVAAAHQLLRVPQSGMGEPKPLLRSTETGSAADSAVVSTFTAQDAMATTLGQIATACTQLLGRVPTGVSLLVPATWGPRRRTAFRDAAHAAGLVEPHLVLSPVAVADHLVQAGEPIPAGSWLVVCDVGADLQVTVLGRDDSTGSWEVLAAREADLGGRAVDAAIVAWLHTLPTPKPSSNSSRWAELTAARTAKEALHSMPATTVALPGGIPAVLTSEQLAGIAAPVYSQIAATVLETIEAAEVPADRGVAVFLVGGGAQQYGLGNVLANAVAQATDGALRTSAVRETKYAAVLGAAGGTSPAAASQPPTVATAPMSPLRRGLTFAAPFVATIVLFWQFVATVVYGGVFAGRYALVNEGELASLSEFPCNRPNWTN